MGSRRLALALSLITPLIQGRFKAQSLAINRCGDSHTPLVQSILVTVVSTTSQDKQGSITLGSIAATFDTGLGVPGLSGEVRRFTAGIRVVTALMCALLLAAAESPLSSSAAFVVLVPYCLWAGWVLWREARGRTRMSALWAYWIDVAWSCVTMKLLSSAALVWVVTLVHPVVVVSIGYGVRHGVVLASVASLGLLWATPNLWAWHPPWAPQATLPGVPTLLALVLVPAAALLARPMSQLRSRLALIGELGAKLDARRGLQPICTELAERLRQCAQADVVALVLPMRHSTPAVVATKAEGSFTAKPEVHAELETLLAAAPVCPVSYVERHRWDLRRRTFVHARALAAGRAVGVKPTGTQPVPLDAGGNAHLPSQFSSQFPSQALPQAPPQSQWDSAFISASLPTSRRQGQALVPPLAALAQLLGVRSLHVVPLTRYGRDNGHFVVGYHHTRNNLHDVFALAGATPELLRIIEQAALVDQLQEETASHERARIGRDLHDSAIQPYLGLKYAVECVALRIAPDNPARAEVDALAELVNGEVAALRELISGLRTGNDGGDSALVPAVRRQVRRFALLFGIEVEIDCPNHLPTTRALASALFHMVNEVLNNIRKHTPATRVWIKLSIEAGAFLIVVRDDAGSVQGHLLPDFRPGSLSERAAELGGSLKISHPDGINTEMAIQIPL
jgi:signal transduction histidine kinase